MIEQQCITAIGVCFIVIIILFFWLAWAYAKIDNQAKAIEDAVELLKLAKVELVNIQNILK